MEKFHSSAYMVTSHKKNDLKYQYYRFEDSRIPIKKQYSRSEKYNPRPNQQETINNFKKAVEGLNFYDRGILDIAAYQEKSNQAIFEELEKAINEHRYHEKVFITPPWKEIYVNDNERKESFEDAMEIHDYLVKAYTENNYQLIEIPKVSLEERLKFVIELF